MAKKNRVTMDDIIEINSSTDGCIHYNAKKDKYIIAYNDQISSNERIYWTLAHELGHYMLGHLKETNRASLARLSLEDEEYNILEKEAHHFARFLVNPPPLINEWEEVSLQRIQSFFKVSRQVAKNTINFLKGRKSSMSLPSNMKSQFNSFIRNVNFGKTCKRCNVFYVIEHADFCPFCGYDDHHMFYKGDEIDVIYPGISHKNGKIDYCPICFNSEILDDSIHCSQCGIYLLNHCTDYNFDYTHGMQYGCEESLPLNSRYCHRCGNKSTFLVNGLLMDWKKTQEEERQREGMEYDANRYEKLEINF